MSNKRKATSTKSQLASVTPACKNNWIFTATLDSDEVEKLCLTIFDIDRKLNSEVFEYAIVGTNVNLDTKKGGGEFIRCLCICSNQETSLDPQRTSSAFWSYCNNILIYRARFWDSRR